jgi:4-diphosphocytidyl-2C-methyl-D-erythritol kinase
MAKQLRTAIRAKKLLHVRTAIGFMFERFDLAGNIQRFRINKHQGAIGGAGGGSAIAAMAIRHHFDIGVGVKLDCAAQTMS